MSALSERAWWAGLALQLLACTSKPAAPALPADAGRAQASPSADDSLGRYVPDSPGARTRGRATFGALEVAEGLDAERIAAFLRARRAAVWDCYERAVRARPSLAGHLSVRFLLTPEARTTDVEVRAEEGLTFEPLEACVRAVVHSWVFPDKPERASRITFGVRLEPEPDVEVTP